jgi:hypothetical protein
MKKTFAFILLMIFSVALPLTTAAESCQGNAYWFENITADGRNLGYCVCNNGGTFPECTSSDDAQRNGCINSGGEWTGSSCRCPSGTSFSSSYRCVSQNSSPTGAETQTPIPETTTDGDNSPKYTPNPVDGNVDSATLENPLQSSAFDTIIDGIVNFLFYLALALAPLMVLFGGYKILTAGDDEKKLTEGKQIIFYAVIGLLIVLFAKGIVSMLKGVIGVKK